MYDEYVKVKLEELNIIHTDQQVAEQKISNVVYENKSLQRQLADANTQIESLRQHNKVLEEMTL
jgi:hypothetical protein